VQAELVEDKFVQIDVEDTGIGIPEEDLDNIFDRFFRSERHEVQLVDGTGLGLAITKSLVEMLGGDIWVKSEVDVGTSFSFTIPLASQFEETWSADEDSSSDSRVEYNEAKMSISVEAE
jgi:signal transduction histidine kinase